MYQEWWNSRQQAKVMGYTKYWNFEQLMDKVAHAMQVERRRDCNEHFREIAERRSRATKVLKEFIVKGFVLDDERQLEYIHSSREHPIATNPIIFPPILPPEY